MSSMTRKQTPTVALAERLCRPQRIGLFGRRGVGKTTLLTMLYREAVGGRLPELRLAAADARTAAYLADKVVQLESGQPLPATLGETDLRFHLYHQGRRVELLVKDYQGEHVAVGRHEPVRDFLRDCDAVWLCLDDVPEGSPADRLQAEQEVEQLVEDYLTARPADEPHRPMALLLTKSDRHADAAAPAERAAERFGMALHALATHSPGHAAFAISSLGGPLSPDGSAFSPRPVGLAEPLVWLVDALRAQDEARLGALWNRAGRDLPLLTRCVTSFGRHYPSAPAAAANRQRLQTLRIRRTRRRVTASAAVAVVLLLALTGYDAYGASAARRFAEEHDDDPAAVRGNWVSYQRWHPTRNLFGRSGARAEAEQMRDLDDRVNARHYAERLAELTRRAADPDADPEEVWQVYRGLRDDFPGREPDAALENLRETARLRRDAARERAARSALADLEVAEGQANLSALIARADRFLREHADTPAAGEVKKRRESYLKRLDEHDIEAARDYSAREPRNFHTRRERYREYLDRHPTGAFAAEASAAVRTIADEWDRFDYRTLRDHYQAHPADLKEAEARGRSYLAAHGQGRFRDAVTEFLRWAEQVVEPHDYRVVLKSGKFDKKIAWYFSRGPDLSVEIEVAGVRYGPSNIVKNRYDPQWDYEFPRRVRWKFGDPVRIRVYDHDYYKRLVLDLVSDEKDPVALWLLGAEWSAGNNTLTFESDFRLPVLPPAE
jgi:hypothetical protein